ncbi:hypothetical protein PYCCODRAFT_1029442 [Trametes coccinea BRFM310]|uniref:Uncharacterized protein n=1 Tax=Trametes coccinea (strain BRFM310) TaxID=1353009 RepID=A0A1Y2IAA8_TRAC3|nr:hypothetical protein PYCCODRAFT_1029442 [Trametes coccinea BRFM310]
MGWQADAPRQASRMPLCLHRKFIAYFPSRVLEYHSLLLLPVDAHAPEENVGLPGPWQRCVWRWSSAATLTPGRPRLIVYERSEGPGVRVSGSPLNKLQRCDALFAREPGTQQEVKYPGPQRLVFLHSALLQRTGAGSSSLLAVCWHFLHRLARHSFSTYST